MSYSRLISGIRQNIADCSESIAVKVGEHQLTYGELGLLADQISRRILHALSSSVNCKQPRIAVCLDRNEHLIPAILAVLMSGCTYVPIDPSTPFDRIKYMVDDCDIDLILTTSDLASRLSTPLPDRSFLILDDSTNHYSLITLHYSLFTNHSSLFTHHIAYIIYTSGTTGVPKGVPITYDALFSLIRKTSDIPPLRITRESRVLQFVSISFDPSVLTIFGALYYGSRLIVATQEQRLDVSLLIQLIRQEAVTYAALPASVISVFPTFELPSLQTLASGGEALPASIVDRGVGHGYSFLNFYGPTENTIMSTYKLYAPGTKSTVIGKPLPGVQAYVVDDDMRPVEKGTVGELLLGGDQLFSGYLGREPFTDQPLYHTGDLVVELPNGDYEYISRKDSQVKLRGYRIELDEIKHRLEQCPGVTQAYVRVETVGNQKQIVAYLTPLDTDLQAVRSYLSQFLPPYMVPAFLVPVDRFQLTINGKIDPTHLRNTALDQLVNCKPSTVNCKQSSDSSTESEITRILCKILELPNIPADVDLIGQLSMTSLQIMEAVSTLEFTGLHISVKDFYDKRTVRELAKVHDASEQCYWYLPPQKGKPVVVVVSGYTSFIFLYTKWAELISDRYNIFVIESYHYIHSPEPLSVDDYIEQYLDMVTPVVEEYGIHVIMGFCLGGEMGLYLAHRLHQLKGITPTAVVIDGEVDRDTHRERVLPLVWKNLPPEINQRRVDLDYNLIKTMPHFTYPGPVTSILAGRLPSNDVNDPNADVSMINDEYRYWLKVFFERTPDYWKKHYPQCHLMILDIDHYDFFKEMEHGVMPIVDYFLAIL